MLRVTISFVFSCPKTGPLTGLLYEEKELVAFSSDKELTVARCHVKDDIYYFCISEKFL